MPSSAAKRARLAGALLLALSLPRSTRAGTAAPALDVASFAVPSVRIFNDKDGLPQNTADALAYDAQGRLWVGTQEGLATYDGVAFHGVALPEDAKSAWVSALAVLPDGTVAIGTHDDGVWLLNGGHFEHLTAATGLPSETIRSLAYVAADRALWIATRQGIVAHEGTTLRAVESPLGPTSIASIASVSGADWIGGEAGVAVRVNGAWRAWRRGEPGLPASVWQLHASADGAGVWASMTQTGLAHLEADHWRLFTKADGLPEDAVTAIGETHDEATQRSRLWVGSGAGLTSFDGQRFVTLDAKTAGLPSDVIDALLPTLPGQGPPALWVGTDGGGLARVQLGGWRALTPRSSPIDAAVYAFGWSTDASGALRTWIGTQTGVRRFDGRAWSTVALPGNDDPYTNAFLEAHGSKQRGFWVGTFGGVSWLHDGAWTTYNTATSKLPANAVLTLREVSGADGEPELLAGIRPGLARFTGTDWEPLVGPSALAKAEVTSIAETGEGPLRTLWIATADAGIFRRRSGRWTQLTTKTSELPCDEVLQVRATRLRDGRDRLFVSTGESGLAWFDPAEDAPRWSRLTSKGSDFPDQVVYGVEQDRSGKIYAFTNHGVARLAPRPAPAAADDFAIQVFRTDDGLPSNECDTGGLAVDPLGRVWAGTVGGAAILDPSSETEDHAAKRLLLESVHLFERPFELPAGTTLTHDQDTLTFGYALTSYHRENETRFRTQLVGLDAEPSPWMTDAKVRYTNLRAGSYELRVWGRDYAGNVSAPLAIPFRVRPAPWNAWWAWISYAVAGAFAIAGIVRFREANHRWRARELEQRVTERTEELAKTVRELDLKNKALLESQERADRIFSAFAEVLPGALLDGKYRIEERIGSGGFGAVFRAEQVALGRPVAVKIFRPAPGNDSALALERFRQEGMSACLLNHPNAVQVFDSGISSEGIAYLVMELLEGLSLADEMAHGPLSLGRALRVAIPVCEGLAAAHAAGLIHRDIKPDNVFSQRTKDGETVKLLDFGIAKLMGADDGAVKTVSAALIGTPRYMAPERLAKGEGLDARSDVYSAGLLLYEMIRGASPWPTDDVFGLITKIVEDGVPDLAGAGIPGSVAKIVKEATSHEPADRPTASELASALSEARASLTRTELEAIFGVAPVDPTAPTEERRHPQAG